MNKARLVLKMQGARAGFAGVLLWFLLTPAQPRASDWVPLYNGKNLEGWESVGSGFWMPTPEGWLLGQWDPFDPPDPEPWLNGMKARMNRSQFKTDFKVVINQAWLYTRREFYEYDLHLEWKVPPGGNSGIALHDPSRGRYTSGPGADLARTPSQIAYEVQIVNLDLEQDFTGSIYMVQAAREDVRNEDDWNVFDIEVRRGLIRVRLNGHLVTEGTPIPGRPESGPIGIQLHDPGSFILLRDIRIRELTPASARE